jgi:hypothetical protein
LNLALRSSHTSDWLISRRWATVEGLPKDPGYRMLAADPQMAEMMQPLLDAWQRLSESPDSASAPR